MLFFKCRISYNELVSMEKNLSGDSFCITRDHIDGFHYGIIRSTEFNKFLNVLSGETLEQLEYLSREELNSYLASVKNKDQAFSGNSALLVE